MPSYDVYFDQVNQTRYEVKALSREDAIKKATRKWIKENGAPFGIAVKEQVPITRKPMLSKEEFEYVVDQVSKHEAGM